MRTAKTFSLKFKSKKAKEIQLECELIHSKFEVKAAGIFGEKGSNSLLALMYSPENEVLFV